MVITAQFIDKQTNQTIDNDMFINCLKNIGSVPSKNDRIVDLDNHIYVVEDVLHTRNKYGKAYTQITVSLTDDVAEPTIVQQIHSIIGDKRVHVTGIQSVAYTKGYEEYKSEYYDLFWMIPVDYNNVKELRSHHYMTVYYTSQEGRLQWRFENFTSKWQEEVLEKIKNGDYVVLNNNE